MWRKRAGKLVALQEISTAATSAPSHSVATILSAPSRIVAPPDAGFVEAIRLRASRARTYWVQVKIDPHLVRIDRELGRVRVHLVEHYLGLSSDC
jgi:hypothetical protein